MMRLASACVLLCPQVHGAVLQPKTASQLKKEGDNFLNKQNPFENFTRTDLENAKEKYLASLRANQYRDAGSEMATQCMLNLTLCHLRLGEFDECVEKCNAFLNIFEDHANVDPENFGRLYYRRAVARRALSRLGYCAEDFRMAYQKMDDTAVILEMQWNEMDKKIWKLVEAGMPRASASMKVLQEMQHDPAELLSFLFDAAEPVQSVRQPVQEVRQDAGETKSAEEQHSRSPVAPNRTIGAEMAQVHGAAWHLKIEGDNLVQQTDQFGFVNPEDLVRAKQKYSDSLLAIQDHVAESHTARECMLNLILVHLKLGEFSECRATCDTFLEDFRDYANIDPENFTRVYFRRAVADSALIQFYDAVIDLQKAEEKSPGVDLHQLMIDIHAKTNQRADWRTEVTFEDAYATEVALVQDDRLNLLSFLFGAASVQEVGQESAEEEDSPLLRTTSDIIPIATFSTSAHEQALRTVRQLYARPAHALALRTVVEPARPLDAVPASNERIAKRLGEGLTWMIDTAIEKRNILALVILLIGIYHAMHANGIPI